MTPCGTRKQQAERRTFAPTTSVRPAKAGSTAASSRPGWLYLFGIIAAGLLLLFVILHLVRGGLGRH
jgi:hypothetical protein